jgi:hypothetical protein
VLPAIAPVVNVPPVPDPAPATFTYEPVTVPARSSLETVWIELSTDDLLLEFAIETLFVSVVFVVVFLLWLLPVSKFDVLPLSLETLVVVVVFLL